MRLQRFPISVIPLHRGHLGDFFPRGDDGRRLFVLSKSTSGSRSSLSNSRRFAAMGLGTGRFLLESTRFTDEGRGVDPTVFRAGVCSTLRSRLRPGPSRDRTTGVSSLNSLRPFERGDPAAFLADAGVLNRRRGVVGEAADRPPPAPLDRGGDGMSFVILRVGVWRMALSLLRPGP